VAADHNLWTINPVNGSMYVPEEYKLWIFNHLNGSKYMAKESNLWMINQVNKLISINPEYVSKIITVLKPNDIKIMLKYKNNTVEHIYDDEFKDIMYTNLNNTNIFKKCNEQLCFIYKEYIGSIKINHYCKEIQISKLDNIDHSVLLPTNFLCTRKSFTIDIEKKKLICPFKNHSMSNLQNSRIKFSEIKQLFNNATKLLVYFTENNKFQNVNLSSNNMHNINLLYNDSSSYNSGSNVTSASLILNKFISDDLVKNDSTTTIKSYFIINKLNIVIISILVTMSISSIIIYILTKYNKRNQNSKPGEPLTKEHVIMASETLFPPYLCTDENDLENNIGHIQNTNEKYLKINPVIDSLIQTEETKNKKSQFYKQQSSYESQHSLSSPKSPLLQSQSYSKQHLISVSIHSPLNVKRNLSINSDDNVILRNKPTLNNENDKNDYAVLPPRKCLNPILCKENKLHNEDC
jgi:hypothetical protein